jgi:ABC-type glycerol-3-phosphate transport system substrate-binding protein
MRIFSKIFITNLFLLVSLLLTSACGNSTSGSSFSFYKTFINPDYNEVNLDEYSDEIKINNEKVDLESVPESDLE